MKRRRLWAAVALAALPIAAIAAVIDFEGFAHGDTLDGTFDFGGGLTGTLSTSGGANIAQIYDTGTVGGEDPDLEAPTHAVDGTPYGGKVMIVAEDLARVDDNAGGGIVTFMFDTLVRFSGITLFDGEASQPITVTTDAGVVVNAGVQGDDEWLAYSFAPVTTQAISVNLAGSGAFDRLVVDVVEPVPLPAGALLLLTGLAGVAAAARRKR